jgi:hypothetical protein
VQQGQTTTAEAAARTNHIPEVIAGIEEYHEMLTVNPMTVHNSLEQDQTAMNKMNDVLVVGGQWSTKSYMKTALESIATNGVFTSLFLEALVNTRNIYSANRLRYVVASDPRQGDPICSLAEKEAIRGLNNMFVVSVFGDKLYDARQDLKVLAADEKKSGTKEEYLIILCVPMCHQGRLKL